jgi:tRNA-2-methylthio-N6-dimethylallyladenosine synthase
MKRYYTREHYLDVVAMLREARPDIVFSTDVIVGFADESDEDFEATMSLLDEVGFVSSFSFTYSPRPGTPALKMPWSTPAEVASARLTRFQARQRELSLAWHRSLEDQVFDVLVEGPSTHDPGVVCGRTSGFAMVNFPGDPSLIGQTIPVRVTRGFTNSARGERTDTDALSA